MHRSLLAAAAALSLLASSAHAQTYEPKFTPEAFKAHVEFLADDLLEGRGTGARGHEIAAKYVATQLEGLGLKPAGADGSWFQPVTLQERSFGPGGARVTISGPGGSKTYENGKGVAISPSALATDEAFEAPVVFVGWGLDAPQYGADDYKGLDVRGKVVAVLSGSPRGMQSEIGAHLGSTNEKSKTAERHGAAGIIIIRTLATESARSFAKVAATANVPRMTFVETSGKAHVEAPSVLQMGTYDVEAAEALFAGSGKTFADIRKAADKTGAKIKGFPLKSSVKLERQSIQRTIVSPNVAGVLPGGDLKDEYVIAMGHLDHLGIRPEVEGDNIYNGAMDNATGIAAILETAKALANAPTPPRRSVLFLAVTAEEKGLLGAEYFSNYPLVPLEKVAGVINMDMPILTYDFGDVVAFGGENSTFGPVVKAAAKSMGLGVSPDPMPEQGIFTRSDHYELVRKGVPAIMLDTGPHDASGGEGGHEASDHFLHNEYHEPSDELDQPFVWSAGAKFAQLNWRIVSGVANDPQPRRWYKGNFFGNTFAPSASKAPAP